MKNLKLILLSSILTIGVFSTATFTSCKKTKTCDGVSCLNGGTCADGTCSCPPGYEGTLCQTKKVEDFSGPYIGTDTCNILGGTMQVTIGQTSATDFTISGLDPGIISTTLTAKGSYNKLTIPAQITGFGGSNITVSGTGTLTGNTINIVYTETFAGGSYTCNFIGTK